METSAIIKSHGVVSTQQGTHQGREEPLNFQMEGLTFSRSQAPTIIKHLLLLRAPSSIKKKKFQSKTNPESLVDINYKQYK